jgi:hypothetical protein
LALAVLALLSASPAFTQGRYEAVISACRWDAKGLCGDALPGDGRLTACIKANFQALGEPCKSALVRTAAVRDACAADIRERCRITKPGSGRIFFCIKKNYAALSEPCRDTIAQAAERRLRAQEARSLTARLPQH